MRIDLGARSVGGNPPQTPGTPQGKFSLFCIRDGSKKISAQSVCYRVLIPFIPEFMVASALQLAARAFVRVLLAFAFQYSVSVGGDPPQTPGTPQGCSNSFSDSFVIANVA